MPISRRALLRQIGVSAMASTAVPALPDLCLPIARSAASRESALIRLDKNEIAGLHNVTAKQVTLGAGSIEILRMAGAAFLRPGKKLILASPTFDAVAD